MFACRRLSSTIVLTSRLSSRLASSSSTVDLSKILQENASYIENKSSSTIAFETFIQTPAEFVANSLLYVHDHLPLPWWATIAIATCTFRVVMGASFTIAQQRLIERLQSIRKDISQELEPRIKYLNMQAMKGKTASVVEEQKHLKREVNHSKRIK